MTDHTALFSFYTEVNARKAHGLQCGGPKYAVRERKFSYCLLALLQVVIIGLLYGFVEVGSSGAEDIAHHVGNKCGIHIRPVLVGDIT